MLVPSLADELGLPVANVPVSLIKLTLVSNKKARMLFSVSGLFDSLQLFV